MTMRTARKLALPVALGLAVAGAYAYILRRPLPKVEGTFILHGPREAVEVIRDRWGVPHIYATNTYDLYFAQGYVHAQDRLWQMEFQRRAGSGRLSEIIGPKALEVDRFMRRLGFHRVAQAEAESLTGEARAALEAYSDGINAYVKTAGGKLPIELSILRTKPEPWKPTDSLVWSKTMAWALSSNWDTELLRVRLVTLLGHEEASGLEPWYPPGHPLIVPPGLEYSGIGDQLLETYRQIKDSLQLSFENGGSNNWVVDGEKSASGKPLLANDPHLIPTAPSNWHEVHLCAPGLNIVGASIPGAPGVVIGHNGRIAWGVTNSMADVQDLYVEQTDPTDPSLYQYCGNWERAQVIREEIRVKGRSSPVIEEVRITRHGPIITSTGSFDPAGSSESAPLAFRWAGLEPGNMVTSLLKLNRAGNWEEFTEALHFWETPSQNFVYADVDGNIGYYLSGKIPIRARGNGMVPVPGWTGEYEWTGYIPFDELPHSFNPESHFAVTANNRIVDDDYPHFISSEWMNGYRARRITDLLQAKERHSVHDFERIQGDCYSLSCSQLAKHLLALNPKNRLQEEALNHVQDWDGCLTKESVGGAVCQVFLWRLQHRVFGHKLADILSNYLGAGLHPIIATNGFLGRSTPILLDLLDKMDDGWLGGTGTDGDSSAGWKNLLEESFAETVTFLRRQLGNNVSLWRWGRLHKVTFTHIFGNIKPLHIPFNRGPYPAGGDVDTVCQSAYVHHEPFGAKSAVSYRQIVDLADLRNSISMHAPGQSGHPASPHYDDFIEPWRAVQYHPMLFEREDVLRHAQFTMHLKPL